IRPIVRAVPDVSQELEQPGPSEQPDWQPDSITTVIVPLPGQVRIDELFDQDAADLADAATDAAAAEAGEADEAASEAEVEPPPTLPLRLAEPPESGRSKDGGRSREGGTRSGGSTSHRSGRRQVPAWDDILLGVRRNQD
ncbi:MAG TPA: hypothetical protein VK816_11350, partial [Jatrophihabitantaceae bacterium]|nr:hypothetical protein [Jatrophihabitantaceae bacterium]